LLGLVEIIDHRLFPLYEVFPNSRFQIEQVGAAATQISELFYFNSNLPLPPTLASLLLCAIYSNTNNFLSDTTNFRDLRMRDWLVNDCLADTTLPQKMFRYKTYWTEENLELALQTDSKTKGNQVIFQLELTNSEVIRKIISHQNTLPRLSNGMDFLLLIQDIKMNRTFISTSNQVNITQIQKHTPLSTVDNHFYATSTIYTQSHTNLSY
jgi:nanoRNase/pAp phosphatase (c-di-AMP/oligoRNAs hydrolase)